MIRISLGMMMLCSALVILFCALAVIAEENVTSGEVVAETTTYVYQNVSKEINVTDMQRIIQPSSSQKQLNLKPPPIANTTDFKPSPQLDVTFEYNQFPVPPAFPEAKSFASVESQAAWKTNVKFPQTRPVTVNDHPYPFMRDIEKASSGSIYPSYNQKTTATGNQYSTIYNPNDFKPSGVDGFLQKPLYSTASLNSNNPSQSAVTESNGIEAKNPYAEFRKPIGLGYYYNKPIEIDFHKPMEKTPTALERPTTFEPKHLVSVGNGFSLSSFPSASGKPSYYEWDKPSKKPSKTYYEEEHHTSLTENPWKKIIKILTAFIPIGLIISALTPSVITIGPSNGTMYTRGRAEGAHTVPFGLNFLSQLQQDGCEDRIFCELLLNAEETDSTGTTVKSLLENYVQGKGNSDKLKTIYGAIKSGDCMSLQCDKIKKKL